MVRSICSFSSQGIHEKLWDGYFPIARMGIQVGLFCLESHYLKLLPLITSVATGILQGATHYPYLRLYRSCCDGPAIIKEEPTLDWNFHLISLCVYIACTSTINPCLLSLFSQITYEEALLCTLVGFLHQGAMSLTYFGFFTSSSAELSRQADNNHLMNHQASES